LKNWYDRHVLPHVIDCVCGMKHLMDLRAELIPQASGRVLEVGIGSGLNLPYYDAQRATHICGLDPSPEMSRLTRKRAANIQIPVESVTLSAEKIDAEDAHFYTVVSTFTLCTIPDAVAALREMRRVLKPNGQMLFCEHGRAPDASVRSWQDRLTPAWKPLAGGCHLNRDIPSLLEAGGFTVTQIKASYVRGPRPMMFIYRGCAQ
jgi:ubiquinone/menaquinone biosynthesis C-methylase UbiE